MSAVYDASISKILTLPFYEGRVPAGFPSPADDYLEGKLDLNEHLITHPAATFYVRVIGDSMNGAKIFDGDLLIVDRAEVILPGQIVFARVESEFCIKQFSTTNGRPRLVSANPKFPDIEITSEITCELLGRVMHSITTHVKRQNGHSSNGCNRAN